MYLQILTLSQDIKFHSAVTFLLGRKSLTFKLELRRWLCLASSCCDPNSPSDTIKGGVSCTGFRCSSVMNSRMSHSDVRGTAVAEQCWQSLLTIMLMMTWNMCRQAAELIRWLAFLVGLCGYNISFLDHICKAKLYLTIFAFFPT